MPQIKINEIDQSIITQVVKDDRVKVFVPIIASFGPVMEARGFTDVSDFYKTYGYTEPLYNPLDHDVSRIYATELIQRGAEVYAIRINSGSYASQTVTRTGKSTLDCIYDSTRSSDTEYVARFADIPASYSIKYKVGDEEATSATITISTAAQKVFKGVLNGSSGTLTSNLNSAAKLATDYPSAGDPVVVTEAVAAEIAAEVTRLNTYFALTSTQNAFKSLQFCEQITGISAKYSGTFGDNLLISITPINTTRLAESYQYANISVYYLDMKTNYTQKSDGTYSKTTVVNNITKLETKKVSTNPSDPCYFEDVEFDFIQIDCTPSARQELTLVWANISSQPAVNATLYSGFPTIPLSYTDENRQFTYNFDAVMWRGSDFAYSNDTLTFLKSKNFTGSFASDWTADDYTKYRTYQEELYGDITDPAGAGQPYTVANDGIISKIYDNLDNCYSEYSDPYMYDFDFITSGGFIDDTYKVTGKTSDDAEKYAYIVLPINDVEGIELYSLIDCHTSMKNLVTERKDCIALCDVYKGYNPDTLTEYVALINTSYATVHFPWCWVTDTKNGKLVLMPPSFILLYTFLSNLINAESSQKWFPPAGVKRATADVVVKPYFEIGSTILDKWQNQGTSHVNPIMKLKQYGYVIYGQYTALPAIDIFTHSALESLNVRLISNVVKKQIFDACLNLAFEPNTSMLWNKFFNTMDDFLRYMKYNNGIYDYRVVMDESTVTTDDINHLKCPGKVYIAPTRTAEFFDIDFYITDAGAVFNE